MQMIELDANTDVGKQRTDNQDNYICVKLWSGAQALIAVIDGVGGYEGGDRAAAIAKESIERYMASPKGNALSMLKEAVVFANNRINEEREKDLKLGQMCCVLTVAVADAQNHMLYYAHVGDTRLYRLRNGMMEKLTRDHSLVGLREDAGELTEVEAMQHPRRNIILRQVGSAFHRIDDTDFLSYGVFDFIPGDTLLICSDGLTDMITSAQMTAVLQKQIPFAQKVPALIALANKMGGNDNITVVLAKNVSKQKQGQESRKTPSPGVSLDAPEEKEEPAKSNRGMRAIIVIVFAAVMLLAMWGPTKKNVPQVPPKTAETLPLALYHVSAEEKKTVTFTPAKFDIDSLIAQTIGSNDRKILLQKLTANDTLKLAGPIQLGQVLSMTGKKNGRLILMPLTGSKNTTAFEVSKVNGNGARRNTIRLKNLLISGFETGILVRRNVYIRLDNVLFQEVKHPVSFESGKDSGKIRVMTFQ
jgi:serine/threonine protein phosphatase PrpC